MTASIYDNYWLADDGRVFGSKTQTIVNASDPNYVAWSSSFLASPWPPDVAGNQTNLSLQAMLTPYNLWVDLPSYNAAARFNKASGGCTIGGKPYMSDPVARNTLGSAHDYAVANPGHITDWKLADGTFIQLNEAGLAHALQQMVTFVQACFTCESNTLASINGATITTKAQVDAAYAAISNVLP